MTYWECHDGEKAKYVDYDMGIEGKERQVDREQAPTKEVSTQQFDTHSEVKALLALKGRSRCIRVMLF